MKYATLKKKTNRKQINGVQSNFHIIHLLDTFNVINASVK